MRLTIIFILILALGGSILYLTKDYDDKQNAKKIAAIKAEKERKEQVEEMLSARFQTFYDSPYLDTINLSHMGIKKLPQGFLDSMKNVVYLDLSHNNIEEMPNGYFYHPTLEHLDMSNNRLERLYVGITDVSKIKHLNLSFNMIDKIRGISWLNNLTHLNLQNNNLIEIDWEERQKDNLTYLNISYNSIQEIPSLYYTSNLQVLIANHNKITETAKRYNGELVYLDLSDNEIKEFKSTYNVLDLKMKTVLLNNNMIERLVQDRVFKSIEHLELNNCNIITLYDMEGKYPNLKYLDIRSNISYLNTPSIVKNLTFIDTLLID